MIIQRRSMSTPILHKSIDNTKKISFKKKENLNKSKSSYEYMYKHLPIEPYKKNFELIKLK